VLDQHLTSDFTEDPVFQEGMIYIMIFTVAILVGYTVFFIWQIFDARKYAKLFNEAVRKYWEGTLVTDN
jgi:hypothetical protein